MIQTSIHPPILQAFISRALALLDREAPEDELLDALRAPMRELVAHADWIPEQKRRVRCGSYAQRLLYREEAGRLSIVCFVWDAGQKTPVHDHGTWGIIGVVEGCELSQAYHIQGDRCAPAGPELRIDEGEICTISTADNIHQVRNGWADRISISIHAYGGDIGRIERRIFDDRGSVRPFVSGYDDLDG